MRSLLFLALLSPAASATEPSRLTPPPRENKPKKKGIVDRIFEPFDGGEMNGFSGPDLSKRKPENPLGTLTVRWVLHFW